MSYANSNGMARHLFALMRRAYGLANVALLGIALFVHVFSESCADEPFVEPAAAQPKLFHLDEAAKDRIKLERQFQAHQRE